MRSFGFAFFVAIFGIDSLAGLWNKTAGSE